MREDLRLVVISSSHAMPKLEEFFDGVPIVDLHCIEEDEQSTRNFEITEIPSSVDTYLDDIVSILCDIHCDQSIKGHFLVFLPSSKVISVVLKYSRVRKI